MTAFADNSLQAQIERGEVFFATLATTPNLERGDNYTIAIETGAKDCYFKPGVISDSTIVFSIDEDVTSFVSSGSLSIFNMRRSDTTTTMLTTVDTISSRVGGTLIFPDTGAGYIIDGDFPVNSPFNLESGLLLKPNTIYVYSFINSGPGGSEFLATAFLREI